MLASLTHSPEYGDFCKGLKYAWKSLAFTMSKPHVHKVFLRFGLAKVLPISLTIYFILFVAAIAVLPATVISILFAPGWVLSILIGVPNWAFGIASKRYPLATSRLFFIGLEPLDQILSAELESRMEKNIDKHRSQSLWHSLRGFIKGLSISAALGLLSWFPLVGWVAVAAVQLYLSSFGLADMLLTVPAEYVWDYGPREKDAVIQRNKFLLLGFALPYALIASIPLAGPAVLSYSQAFMAYLYYHELQNQFPPVSKEDEM